MLQHQSRICGLLVKVCSSQAQQLCKLDACSIVEARHTITQQLCSLRDFHSTSAALRDAGHSARQGARSFASSAGGAAAKERLAQQQKGWQQRSAKQGWYLVAMTAAMVGLTYASVPLYRMFCQATGYGGTVQIGKTVEEKLREREENANPELEAAAAARHITVSFNADLSDGMPWRFRPTQRAITVTPGQSALAFYTAQNLSESAITGMSTYNVTPQQCGVHFNKIQCFCFEEQKLLPGEQVDMPVFFYIDPEFATDPRMRGIDHLTLSYTFFKIDEEDPEKAAAQVAALTAERQRMEDEMQKQLGHGSSSHANA